MTLKVEEKIEDKEVFVELTKVTHAVSTITNHLMVCGKMVNAIELLDLKPTLIEKIDEPSYVDKFVSQVLLLTLYENGLIKSEYNFVKKLNEEFNGAKIIEIDASELIRQFPWAYYEVLFILYRMFDNEGPSVRNAVINSFTKNYSSMNPAKIPELKHKYSSKQSISSNYAKFHFTCPDVFRREPIDYYIEGVKMQCSLDWIVKDGLLRFLYENCFIDFGKSYVKKISIDEHGYIDAVIDLDRLFKLFPYAYMTYMRQLEFKLGKVGKSEEALEALQKHYGRYCPINIYNRKSSKSKRLKCA